MISALGTTVMHTYLLILASSALPDLSVTDDQA